AIYMRASGSLFNGDTLLANATAGDGGLVIVSAAQGLTLTQPVQANGALGGGSVILQSQTGGISAGSIQARGTQAGGQVFISDPAGVVLSSIDVSSSQGAGGQIYGVDFSGAGIQVSGSLVAEGATAGGSIIVSTQGTLTLASGGYLSVNSSAGTGGN